MYRLEFFEGKRVLKSSFLDDFKGVQAFFTTRDLPLKYGEREDLKPQIEANKKLICKGFGISENSLIIPEQTHSDNVQTVEILTGDFALQNRPIKEYKNTDALISKEKNIAIALNFADCVPLIFYDPDKTIIASAHAGWRGTVAQIGIKTVQKMIDEFGCEAKSIIALIGPAIGKCCFEVGEDVRDLLKQSISPLTLPLSHNERGNNSELANNAFSENQADLKLINKLQLLAIGVEKIDVCEYCTFCQNELFFSYRKENGNTARHSAVIINKGRE